MGFIFFRMDYNSIFLERFSYAIGKSDGNGSFIYTCNRIYDDNSWCNFIKLKGIIEFDREGKLIHFETNYYDLACIIDSINRNYKSCRLSMPKYEFVSFKDIKIDVIDCPKYRKGRFYVKLELKLSFIAEIPNHASEGSLRLTFNDYGKIFFQYMLLN